MTDLDFAAVIDYSLRKRPERGDEASAHISDLFGCDRAAWARRRGEPMLPFSRETLVKFAMGRAVEDTVALALREDYPGDSARDVDCKLGEMIGHADVTFDNGTFVEVKSTAFFRGKPPEEPDAHYIEQAAGYAVALNAKRFGICLVDRISGKVLTWWFDTADYAEETLLRAAEVLERTDPALPFMPEPAPRQSWSCKTCRFAGCELNVNPMKAELEAVV